MQGFTIFSTGIEGLDQALDGIQPGDSILWLADTLKDYVYVVDKLFEYNRKRQAPAIYINCGDYCLYHPSIGRPFHYVTCDIKSDSKRMIKAISPYAAKFRFSKAAFILDPLENIYSKLGKDKRQLIGFLNSFLELLADYKHIAYLASLGDSLPSDIIKEVKELTTINLEISSNESGFSILAQKVAGRFNQGMYKRLVITDGQVVSKQKIDEKKYIDLLIDKIDELITINKSITEQATSSKRELEFLNEILESSAEAIIIVDRYGYIRTWNQGAERLFGYKSEEMYGKPLNTLFGLVQMKEQQLDDLTKALMRKNFVMNYIFTARTRDDEEIFIDMTNTLIRDEEGDILGTSIIMRDITDRVLLERWLQKNIEELTILNNLSRLLYSTLDLEEIFKIVLIGITANEGLAFNRAFLFLYDEETESLAGRMAVGPSSPQEAGRIWNDLKTKSASIEDILHIYRSGDDSADQLLNQKVREIKFHDDKEPENIIFKAFRERRTVRVMAGKMASPAVQRLKDALGMEQFAIAPLYDENHPVGIIIADNFITGKGITDADLAILGNLAFQTGSAISKAKLYVELDKKVEDLDKINLELKQNQQLLLKYTQLSAIGEIATKVAHEIRNPLSAIGGLSRSLRDDLVKDESSIQVLDIIISEVDRLENIVNEILNMAKPVSIKKQPKDLHDILRNILEILEKELKANQVLVKLCFDESIPLVMVDEERMRQVFLNLIMNAIQAMPNGGELTISTSRSKNNLIVEIIDNGVGIAQENLKQIFNPFFTTKSRGSGLGLNIVKQIIAEHNGMIDVESKVDHGTRIIIKLPLSKIFKEVD